MLKTMLIGLDGTPFARSAVNAGLQWARESGASLVGLGIVDEPTICAPEAVPVGAAAFKEQRDASLLSDARRSVEALLQEFRRDCTAAGVGCETIEAIGLPTEQIQLAAQRCDLVLLGQETHFHFETQQAPDDILRDVMRQTPRPVVVVPERPQGGSTVVICYDGSVQAARTLQLFQCLGIARGLPLHIVTIADDRAAAEESANRAVAFLRSHEIVAEAHPVADSRHPAASIRDEAARLDARLIVMGACGKSALREAFFGSVTRTLLEESSVPLFLYH